VLGICIIKITLQQAFFPEQFFCCSWL